MSETTEAEVKHHPVLYRAGRHGCWGGCICGWPSKTWTSVVGVHLEFGRHLVDVGEIPPAVFIETPTTTRTRPTRAADQEDDRG